MSLGGTGGGGQAAMGPRPPARGVGDRTPPRPSPRARRPGAVSPAAGPRLSSDRGCEGGHGRRCRLGLQRPPHADPPSRVLRGERCGTERAHGERTNVPGSGDPLTDNARPPLGGPRQEPRRRRPEGTSTTRAGLRPRGAVPMILSTPRRHQGPTPTQRVVTPLPEGSARPVVDGERRRWSVARLWTAWHGATEGGQPQVTQAPHRLERSGALALRAARRLLTCRAHDRPHQGSWRALPLPRTCTWPLAQAPVERSAPPRFHHWRQACKAA